MLRFVLTRVSLVIPTFIGITLLTFLLIRLIPGDPIRAAMQQNVDLSDQRIVEETRARFGLDRPIPVQFAIWLRDFAAGDLQLVAR